MVRLLQYVHDKANFWFHCSHSPHLVVEDLAEDLKIQSISFSLPPFQTFLRKSFFFVEVFLRKSLFIQWANLRKFTEITIPFLNVSELIKFLKIYKKPVHR